MASQRPRDVVRINSRGLTNDAEFVLGDDVPAQLFLQRARLHR
jgi:hypothetical protein